MTHPRALGDLCQVYTVTSFQGLDGMLSAVLSVSVRPCFKQRTSFWNFDGMMSSKAAEFGHNLPYYRNH